MGKLKAVLVELSDYERILPLASGYLQAYAMKDPAVAATWSFSIYTRTVRVAWETILAELVEKRADLYGFSTYVWNSRLVTWLVARLGAALPNARIVLGGPQVVKQPRYLDRERPNVFLCNGEGEITFANLVRELATERPDLSRVRGLTFHRDGELFTTEDEPKIQSLDDIPSPFLTGVFPPRTFTQAIFETNRGCPFRCSFCYWGLGDQRVTKFTEDRLREEIDWLCSNGFLSIFFADANFGMLERDVRIATQLAHNRRTKGVPYMLAFNSAKNKPERLVEIARIVQQAGIHTTQSIAVQSLDEDTLKRTERGNIRLSAYTKAQSELNDAQISSYTELIWPLPGETLATFKRGVERLCEIGTQSFVAYPLVLLQNTGMYDRREEHGIVTVEDGTIGSAGDYNVVVQTNEVSGEVHDEGLRFINAAKSLYNTRALRSVGTFLHRTRRTTWSDLFTAFAAYGRQRTDVSYAARAEQAIRDRSHSAWTYWGETYHLAFHQLRTELETYVHDFASQQPWWDEDTELLFELELLTRPYLYANTKIVDKSLPLRHFRARPSGRGYEVQALDPARLRRIPEAASCPLAGGGAYRIGHERDQLPFMARESPEKNFTYCYGAAQRIQTLMPSFTALDAGGARVVSEAL